MPGFKCNCIEEVNALLAESNTTLSLSLAFPRGEPGFVLPTIMVEKIEPRKRGRTVTIAPSFCPFCGLKAGAEPPARSSSPDTTGAS